MYTLHTKFQQTIVLLLHCLISRMEGGWNCEIRVNPKPGDPHGTKPKHLIASYFAPKQKEGKIKAATIAVERLKKYCTYIEVNDVISY